MGRSVSRNPTELSKACNEMVERFLESGERKTFVADERWSQEALYNGLRRTCAKVAYRDDVYAAKTGSVVMLARFWK